MIILEQLIVASLGILLYYLWKFKSLLKKPKDLKAVGFLKNLWSAMKFKILWTYCMLVVLTVTTFFYPELASSITTITGFDISNSIISFFTLGATMSSVVDTKE